MKLWIPLASTLFATIALQAQPSDWSHPVHLDVALSSFRFEPATLHLKRGQAYTLHLHNVSDGGHDFVAKDFFARATLAPASRQIVRHGEVGLHGGDAQDVTLIASALGTYELHCSHFMHQTMGMKGAIIVE